MAAILGIVGSFLGPAIELGKCLVVPMKREFNYLCCFNSNIHILKEEAKALENARDGLKMRVTSAENNAEVILPQVEAWLKDANEILVKMDGFEVEITNMRGAGCLAVKSRYSLTKKIKKTAEAMKELRSSCDFNPISQPATPLSMVPTPLGTSYEFQSRKSIEESIMNTLRGKSNNIVVGICGMGGVGKTTMARKIMDRANKEKMYDELLMAVVSQEKDMVKVQDDIAKQLGLALGEGSLPFRAHKLRTRLMCGRRILIVLDDVWKTLKLEDLGIPCQSDSKGCTVILTSRNMSVFSAMNVEKVFTLEVLSDTEAWYLFKQNVGSCVDDMDVINFVAKEVVKECKGLPIALVTVGVALKDKKNPSSWKDALQQLKDSNPVDMPEVLDEVYKPLRLSYDLLESDHAKSLFLLCCLFPEDHYIPLDQLSIYAMGLRLFGNIKSLEQTRNKAYSLIEMLKSRFLLLDDDTLISRSHVRMHDVIRDVAIFIASKDKLINCNDCAWISFPLQEGTQHSMRSNPNLRLLLIESSEGKGLEIGDNFFEGIRELNVLSIDDKFIISLPHTTQLLKNLRTLILNRCRSLETIYVVGELVSLEILRIYGCDLFRELPIELKKLKHLKLLHVLGCWGLKTIVPGIISSLVQLEELEISDFDQWDAEVEGKGRNNASLTEFQSLHHLTTLWFSIENFTLVAQEIQLPPNIVNYDITIGACSGFAIMRPYTKKLRIALEKGVTPGNWIHKLLRSTEGLWAEGDGSRNLLISQCHQNLKYLTLINWSALRTIADVAASVDDWQSYTDVFPLLESLNLFRLDNLEDIWDGSIPIGSNSFANLKKLSIDYLPALKHLGKSCRNNIASLFCNLSSIDISNCDSLRNLFELSGAGMDCLPQLEELDIRDCQVMEYVVLWNGDGDENENNVVEESRNTTIFPRLKRLTLCYLPGLTTFCKGIESIEFPLLTVLRIENCPNLKGVVPAAN